MDATTKTRLTPTAVPISYTLKSPSGSPMPVKMSHTTYLPPKKQQPSDPEIMLPSCSGHGQVVVESPLKVKPPKKVYQPLEKRKRPSPSLKSESPHFKEILASNQTVDIAATSPPKSKRKLMFEETPRKKKMKFTIEQQKKTIKSKKQMLQRLRGKIEHLKDISKLERTFDSFNFPSIHSKTIAKMQCKTKHRKWSSEERNLALLTFYKSPSTYNFLRRQGIVLPAASTIRHWIGASKFSPGVSARYMKQIKMKFQEYSTNEKCCVLCFDEMSIAENLSYSKDMDYIEGYEDLGHLGRSKKAARYALVFLIRGLYLSWKLPIAYFLSHTGVKGTQLSQLITDIIEKLFEVGLIPKVCVCDQGATNRSALKNLGVTKSDPHFMVGEKRMYSIFDVPHLVKSLRNNLLNGDFIVGQKQISFKDIVTVYNIDKKNAKSKALPTLTDSHVFPNSFQKMSVKRAVQIFSNSVAAAIKTCIISGELQSETASDTAEFIDFINKLFDCLNSRNIFSSNPYNSALSANNLLAQNIFDKAKEVFDQIQKIDPITKKNSRPPCFDGFMQTIIGITMLFKQEQERGIQFILTNRLNQDVLENQFSIYCQRGRYCRNPTAKLLRTSFRSNAVNNLMKLPESSNCEPDFDISPDIIPEVDSPVRQESDESSSTSTSTPTITSDRSETLEDCSLSYFAGYLAYKCYKEFNCETCDELFTQDVNIFEKNQLLIITKLYDTSVTAGLKAHSKMFRKIIDVAVRTFEKYYHLLSFKKQLSKTLFRKIEKKIIKVDSCYFNHETCKVHRDYIIKHLIVCKIHKCASFTPQIKLTEKLNPKLRILSHL